MIKGGFAAEDTEEILKKIGDFSGFFLILGANHCSWVKNWDWYVNLQGLGEIDKKNASKNAVKLG